MAQLKRVADLFGEVNVYPAGYGKQRVVATILMEPNKEGTQTGIALDGSGSMANLYGMGGGGAISPVFAKKTANLITPVAQKVCAYLARKLDADGGTTCIYWATGQAGGRVELVGDLTADQAERHTFGPPQAFGTGTQLLPAVRYFVDRFKDAPYGFYVFITDGELHDLDDVKRYSAQLAKDIAARRRKPLKFVLIGIGDSVNEAQMEELDDLETGTNVDLWDHKLAKELTRLEQIFAEVVDENARVAERGRIVDPMGRTLVDYSDTGVPAKLQFEVPNGIQYFTLEVNGNKIHQGLTDHASVPPSHIVSPIVEEVLPVTPMNSPPPLPTSPPPLPVSAPTPPPKRSLDELDSVVSNEAPVEISKDSAIEPKKQEEEIWTGFDLTFEEGREPPDLDIKKDDKK